jgi:carbamoyltransferase
MLILGITGSPELVHENRFALPFWFMHDSAAVLIEDGKVVFAAEEERLNRIKHTNRMPAQAIRACLESRGVQIKDIDVIAYYQTEATLDMLIKRRALENNRAPCYSDAVTYIHELYERGLEDKIDVRKFHFVHHHMAHAMSAFAMSGFESSLITTFDGEGDGASGMAFQGSGVTLKPLATFDIQKSLGFFYCRTIAYLGYEIFDEYKVMGLAPYGDPERFRSLFRKFYTLLPEGDYQVHFDRLPSLFEILSPRRKGEPFSQKHKDIAAALQEALEEIVFHVLRHYRERTKEANLCLAGGVAHNCTLNGNILRSGLFENVFVQPAAHDAGGALGAALCAYYDRRPKAGKPAQMKHVFWGRDIGGDEVIQNALQSWRKFLSFQKVDRIAERAAGLLANGYVIGWAQGRSEFGPRALGNRSILADPRPSENKDRINRIVKKREGYRPFAPSVLEEFVDQFFEVEPAYKQHPFMVFVVGVKEDKRQLLGAITHVDGTARIQTVSKETNPKYWDLIDAFRERTGIPMVLNTSFNNNAEPVVDSVQDAIVAFLTTGLDYLVIGNYLVEKRDVSWRTYLDLAASLRPYASLHQVRRLDDQLQFNDFFYITATYRSDIEYAVSSDAARALQQSGKDKKLREVLEEARLNDESDGERIAREITGLWSERLIDLNQT